MGIRNPLEQNLLETKEQKEDVTTAWLMFYMVNPITNDFRTKRPYKPTTTRFLCLACERRINKKLSQISGFIVL